MKRYQVHFSFYSEENGEFDEAIYTVNAESIVEARRLAWLLRDKDDNAQLQSYVKQCGVDYDALKQEYCRPAVETEYNVEEHSGSEYYVQGEGFNWPLNSVVIKKSSAITGELLAGAAFELYRADEQVSGVPGTNIGRYTTDHSGVIVITGLEPGFYVVKEVQAPQNYLISENSQQNGLLKTDGTTVLEFTFANYPYGSILISKVDALTSEPLSSAQFKVVDSSGAVVGNTNGEYVTDSRGEILIPNVKPGSYVITEIQAPANYAINTTPQTIEVGTDGKTYKVSFDNYAFGGIVIRKRDRQSNEPIMNAEFKVTRTDGTVVGTSNGIYTTDAAGTITIPNLPKDSYIITEIKAAPGYLLESTAQTISVEYGKTYTLDVYNTKLSGVQILKIDSVTKAPLKDAQFILYKKSGEIVGRYTTDGAGVIIIDNLAPGWYKAAEEKAPDGYLIDDTAQDFEITSGQFVKLVFENKVLASLQIRKVSESDGSPLAAATFEVRKQNGEYVGEYTTGADGSVSIPNVTPGWYVISETKAPKGFILDTVARTVEVKPITPTVVTISNKPLAGLQIIKLNSATREPIQNVEFSLTKQNGEKVGTFKTAKDGTIFVPDLEPGWYVVSETSAADGFILDAEPRNIEVVWGKTTTCEVLNTPATTNKGDQRIIADNLSATKNNVIDCSNAALGLGSDEYVTSFTLVFGTVKAGFTIVEKPQIYVKVNQNLTNGYRFANKADTGGKYGREWVVANTTWTTTTYAKTPPLPRTGY